MIIPVLMTASIDPKGMANALFPPAVRESQYVAIYKDRPRDIQTAYDMAFKLLV